MYQSRWQLDQQHPKATASSGLTEVYIGFYTIKGVNGQVLNHDDTSRSTHVHDIMGFTLINLKDIISILKNGYKRNDNSLTLVF